MGAKEKLQKELDLILEKLRFWRYVIFAMISAVIGVLFSLTQKKIIINFWLFILFLAGFLLLLFSVKRIAKLTKDYYKFLGRIRKGINMELAIYLIGFASIAVFFYFMWIDTQPIKD